MKLDQTFNANDLPEGNTGNFDPIPAGWYTARIADAEVRDTKAGTGQFIAIRYDIVGPSYEGRVVFSNVNIKNPNPKAEEIGRQQLGDMMRAIGLVSVEDTDQLIGGQCQIKVAIQKSEEYGDKNEVKGWKAQDGAMPQPSADKPAAASSGESGGAKPPWAK